MAQSTVEDKFVYATSVIIQTLCVKKYFRHLILRKKVNTEVHVDNQDAIAILHNPVFYEKTKHLNVNLFFLSDVQKKGE